MLSKIPAILVCAVWLIIPQPFLATSPTTTLLAKGTLPAIPDGDFMFRVVELTQAPDDPAVTHQHLPSMVYAIDGPHMMTINGKQNPLSPGQATWINDQEPHSHGSDGKTASHFIAISLPLANTKGTLRFSPEFRNARVAFESSPLIFAEREKQDVILTDNAYQPGDDSGIQRYAGPTMFSFQTGRFVVTLPNASLSLQAGDYLMVQPGISVQFHSESGGRVLAFSIVPAGQSTLLPQAGATQTP